MPLPVWGLVVGVVIGLMASPNPVIALYCGGGLALMAWAITGFRLDSESISPRPSESAKQDKWKEEETAQPDTTDPEIQFKLGQAFRMGEGVEKNLEEAFSLIQKAATSGNLEAQNMLGFMYVNGEGVEKNRSEAYKWYLLAAEKGNVKAQTNLGYLLSDEYSEVVDYEGAVKWLTEAVNQGESTGLAHEQLASLFYKGKGVPKDLDRAFGLYLQASMRDSPEAERMLEVMHAKGEVKVKVG
jgi:TPR repeat protein